jgi:hypothetical protein
MIQLSELYVTEQYAQISSISLKRLIKSRKSQPQTQSLHLQNTKQDNAYHLFTVTSGKADHFLHQENGRTSLQTEVQSFPPIYYFLILTSNGDLCMSLQCFKVKLTRKNSKVKIRGKSIPVTGCGGP